MTIELKARGYGTCLALLAAGSGCAPSLSGQFHVLTDQRVTGDCSQLVPDAVLHPNSRWWPVFPQVGAWWTLAEHESSVSFDTGNACPVLTGERQGSTVTINSARCSEFTSSGSTIAFEWLGGTASITEEPVGLTAPAGCKMTMVRLSLDFSATSTGASSGTCAGTLTGTVNQLQTTNGCPTS